MERANEIYKQKQKDLLRKDRKAYVKFYLLEDVLCLCKFHLKQLGKKVETDHSEQVKYEIWDINFIKGVTHQFLEIVEVTCVQIQSGYYKAVWKSIPEKALMKAAKKHNFIKLKKLATKIWAKVNSTLAEMKCSEKKENLEKNY